MVRWRCLCVLVLLLCPLLAWCDAPRVLDMVDLSAPASRDAHGVLISKGKPQNERFMVGTRLLPVAGVLLEKDGRLRARLRTSGAGGMGVSLLLTLATAPQDYGRRQVWRVLVDGREVCRRSERDPGGGLTRSAFLDLPATRDFADVDIASDPATEAPVVVSSVRVYAGLNPLPSDPRLRMGLALLTNKGIGYSLDAETLKEIAGKLPRSSRLEGQAAVLYNFSVRNAAANRQEIERLAGLAEQAKLPLRIAFQFHWAGIPSGVPDGAGGTFTDVPYQMITYDPEDQVDDPGLAALMGDRYDKRFGLSVPNVWGDTPWLTFNHPRLNQFRRVRLLQVLAAWRAARERLAASGKARLLPPELSTGEETIYWARGVEDGKYTALNGSKPRADLMADFNPFVMADALRDGIYLDPRDGLNGKERWWLHQNLARQQQRIVDWMLEGMPAEPVRMSGGTPVFFADLVRRNIYTEPYAMPCFPMKETSLLHPGLEVGYVREGRSGGEYWSGATMLPWLLKERERGRIALPNLECTGADDPQLLACLRAAYACGARFATLYNWHYRPHIADLLRAFADSIEKPPRMEWLPGDPRLTPPGQKLDRSFTAPPDAFGINRVDLYTSIRRPLRTRVTLRDADPARASAITVTTVLPPSPGPSAVPAAVFLPSLFPLEPGRRYLLTAEVLEEASEALASAVDDQLAATLSADLMFERARSLAIEDWQDAADLLDSLRERFIRTEQSRFAREALEEAEDLFRRSSPGAAYRAGIRAEQLALPAAFDLPAPGGRLAPYWITILCPGGPVRAVVTAYNDRTAVVSLRSAVAQTVTLRRGNAETTAALSPEVPAEISLELGAGGRTGARGRGRRP